VRVIISGLVFLTVSVVGLWADAVPLGTVGVFTPVPVATIGGDPAYSFTFSDPAGDKGYGILETASASLNSDGGYLALTGGTLVLTGSSDNNKNTLGNYSLIPTGGWEISPSGLFSVDDLVFPNNNAAAATFETTGHMPAYYAQISGDSYLTNGGLLFGPAGGAGSGNQNEINIFGNGGPNNYSFWSEHGGGFNIEVTGGGTFTLTADSSDNKNSGVLVPEPGVLTLLSAMLAGLGALYVGRGLMAKRQE
jgi:hypothetical protein